MITRIERSIQNDIEENEAKSNRSSSLAKSSLPISRSNTWHEGGRLCEDPSSKCVPGWLGVPLLCFFPSPGRAIQEQGGVLEPCNIDRFQLRNACPTKKRYRTEVLAHAYGRMVYWPPKSCFR
jgi:hypothetical protein